MSSLVPEGWEVSNIERNAQLVTDGAHLSPPTKLDGLPIATVQNMLTRSIDMASCRKISHDDFDALVKGNCAPRIGDVLFSKDGTVGKTFVYLQSETIVLLSSIAIIRLKKDQLDPEFCSQYLRSPLFYHTLENTKSGSAIRRIVLSDLKRLELPKPPLPEQQKIATILSSVDDVIEKTRAQIDKLKDLKTGMMQELLTKGVGVDGVPHTEFKDSPVGRIPVGWDVESLGEVFTLSSGSTPSRSIPEFFSTSLDAHPWVKTMDLNDGVIYKTDEKITDSALFNSSCKILPEGTVMVAMYGGWNQIGRSGLLAIKAATNQAIIALVSKGVVDGAYANYWLAATRYRWKSIAASSRKDPNITKQDVSDFLISVPSVVEQKSIVVRLDAITKLVDDKMTKLTYHIELKKALMQDLLTGKVRVNVKDKESAVA